MKHESTSYSGLARRSVGQGGFLSLRVLTALVISFGGVFLTLPAKAIIYDEAVSGELSKDNAAPTALTLTPGLNSLIGTVANSQDWVSFTIPAGFVMTSYVNSKYNSTDDQGFTGFQFGSSFSGDQLAPGSYAGYAHFGFAANNPDGNPVGASTVGVDLLPLMANPNFAPGAAGFTPPLAAGTYTFLIQQGPGGAIRYQFDMTVVPGGIGLVEVFKLPSASPLANISTRLNVGIGDNVLIGGFIIAGPDNKKVVLRAIGPSLSNPPVNLTGVLADPTIELHDATQAIIATNDNWKDTQQSDIAATGLAPTNDFESAISQTLAPGSYTAIVRGKNGGTGLGLVEVYDADPGVNAALTNISTRGFVGTDNNVMIGGFVVGAGGSATVVVRAKGPSLANPPFNLTGVLQDPVLSLFDANGAMIASNDNWKDTQQAQLQASGLAPTNDFESAILQTLAPGAYTAIVRGR